jgi:hypothetical protein
MYHYSNNGLSVPLGKNATTQTKSEHFPPNGSPRFRGAKARKKLDDRLPTNDF